MKDLQFPLTQTKVDRPYRKFNLSSPDGREEYFEFKVGKEIKALREFLKENTFIAYLLGKKSAGKGTYSKLLGEIMGPGCIDHFSVGDMMRRVDKELEIPKDKAEFKNFLEKNYRGFISLEEIIESLEGRSTEKLLPTELILTLVKREIAQRPKQTLFIDGFPRNMDQVSYSLFFRELIDYRDDPDIFILIDIPESVIDERMKTRVVCPKCHTPRNIKLLPTEKVEYDKETQAFYLLCDNPECQNARMVKKEGDELGIETIRKRLDKDEELLGKVYSLHGLPKILLRNHVPIDVAEEYVDDYEITPEYHYHWNEKDGKVEIETRPFIIEDDRGVKSYSLLAPAVVVSMIKQLVEVFDL